MLSDQRKELTDQIRTLRKEKEQSDNDWKKQYNETKSTLETLEGEFKVRE
jgi:hypothetical protein